MIFPKHQPIIFEPYLPNECSCDDATFRLLAKQTDVCQFQVIVNPCEGTENVLCNPAFSASEFNCNNWVTSGGFTLNDQACCTEATGTATQFESLVIGNVYQCEIIVASLVGTLYIYNGATGIQEINHTGTTLFTFTATSQDIQLSLESTEHSVCISSFSARPLSLNLGFGIINSSGITVDAVTLGENPTYFTFTKDRVTVKFTWSDFDVQEGQCYTIGFADGCSNLNGQFGVFNSSFDNCLTGWTINVGTLESINCEQLENPTTGDVENCIEFANSGTGNITSFVTTLKPGYDYNVVLTGFSTDADGVIRVYCGTNFETYTADDTILINCVGNGEFKIEAVLNTSTYIRIWDIEVSIVNMAFIEFDYESHPFKVGANDCTHLLNLSNDDDGLGFVFEGSNFAPQIRVESVIKNSVPEFIKENYHSNLGTKQNYYGEYRKHHVLHVDYVPAWVFDFLCLCFIADHFFVDGVEYFIEGDSLETNYPENVCYTNMTALKVEISEKTQLFRNANTGESNPVTFGGQQLLTDGNGDAVTELFTGTAIDVPL